MSDLHSLAFLRVNVCNPIVVLLVEGDRLDVVKHTQQVCLYGVRIARLAKDLKESGVRDEEEAREDQTLFLQVTERGENEPLLDTSLRRNRYRDTLFTLFLFSHTKNLTIHCLHNWKPSPVENMLNLLLFFLYTFTALIQQTKSFTVWSLCLRKNKPWTLNFDLSLWTS